MDPLLLLGLVSLGASIFGGIRASGEASRQQSLMEEAMRRQLGLFEPTLAKLAPLFDVALQGLGAGINTTTTTNPPSEPTKDTASQGNPLPPFPFSLPLPPEAGLPISYAKDIIAKLFGVNIPPTTPGKPGEDIVIDTDKPAGYEQSGNLPSGSGQGSGSSGPNIDWNNLLSGISLPSAPNVFLGDITKPLADQFALLQGRALANASATAAAAGLSGGGLAAAADMDVRSQIAGQIAEQLVAWERQKPELALKQAALNLDAASRAYELALKKAGLQLSEWQTGQEFGLRERELGLRGQQMDISKNLAILQTYLQAQQFLASILGQHAGVRGDLSKEAMSGTQGMFSWLPIAMMSGLFKGA